MKESEFSAADVIHCLERLADVAPLPDSTGRALERVREALRDHAPPEFPLPSRRKMLRRALKAAAVLLIAAGSVFVLHAMFRGGSTLAFAQVVKQFRDAHTLAYQQTVQSDEIKSPMTMQVFEKEPGWTRTETSAGPISIGRREKDQTRILTLDAKTKTAVLIVAKKTNNEKEPGYLDPMRLVEKLRGLVNKDAQPSGTKRIGNADAGGFRVQEGAMEMVIWADPKTQLPVEVEIKLPGNVRSTLSEFRFNPPLDDALFSLDVPKTYSLQPMELEVLPPEESLVRLLRFCAETSHGRFPKRLDDPGALGTQLRASRGDKPIKTIGPEDMRVIMDITRAVMFVTTLKSGYGYEPEGAKFGDANKVLFWYRPEGATKWRALNADLHWAELTTDRLPKKPKP